VTRRRAGILGLAATLGLVLPAATACGIQPSGIVALGPAPAAAVASPIGSLDTSAGSTQYLLFFYLDGQLSPVYRPTKNPVTESTVLQALVQGPNAAEQSKGYSTMLPAKLAATPRASGLLDAYSLSQPLALHAKAQFICTMQYYDQTISVGIQILGSITVNWNACSDTTTEYIPMQGDTTVATATAPSG
jgi:hypothetical protein